MKTNNLYGIDSFYYGLNYSTKLINKNFRIKVSGVNFEGEKLHKLIGVSGLIDLLGIELANNLFDRAFNSIDDKCVCKLRRGLKVVFYNK